MSLMVSAVSPVVAAGSATARHRPLRVLVAEDHPLNQRLVVTALTRLGHTGVLVKDGAQALQCLAHQRFDLVLMDDQMPGMDGMQAMAAQRQREREGAPRVPVIVVTANDMAMDRQRYLLMGADGYVAKPVEATVLQQEMERVLGRH